MSYIYVAESGAGYVKIGKSDSPRQRQLSIQKEMGLVITRFKSFECVSDALKSEFLIHQKLADKNSFREWFNVSFEDACAECDLISKSVFDDEFTRPSKANVIMRVGILPAHDKYIRHKVGCGDNKSIAEYFRRLISDDMFKDSNWQGGKDGH